MRSWIILPAVLLGLGAAPLAAEVLVAKRGDLDRAVRELEASFPVVSGRVVSVVDNLVYTDLAGASGARPGMEVSVYREGEEIVHPLTRQALGRFEVSLGTLRLTQVAGGYAGGEASGDPSLIKPGDLVRTTATRLRVAVLVPSALSPPREGWPVEFASALERSIRFTPLATSAPVPQSLPDNPAERARLARDRGADLVIWAAARDLPAGRGVRLECFSAATGFPVAAVTLAVEQRGEVAGKAAPASAPAAGTRPVPAVTDPFAPSGE